MGDAAERGQLKPTEGGLVSEGVTVEYADGTRVVGNSVTGGRVRVLAKEFFHGRSKLERDWDVIGSESKVFQARVCLTPNQVERLRDDVPDLEISSHLTVAQMRYVTQRFFNQTTLVHVHPSGEETRIKAPFSFVAGDIKSLCIHMGQDNKCPCCELRYNDYDCRLYGSKLRTAKTNNSHWDSSLDEVAMVMGTACVDEAFSASLTKVNSETQLREALAQVDARLHLGRVRANLGVLFGSFSPPPESMFSQRFLEHYEEVASQSPSYKQS
jgi:hypothetical protein